MTSEMLPRPPMTELIDHYRASDRDEAMLAKILSALDWFLWSQSQLFARLTSEQFELAELFYGLGGHPPLTQSEIAEQKNLSVRTVEGRLREIRKELREIPELEKISQAYAR